MKDICYWSVGDGDFASMIQGLVSSMRNLGITDDFIAFSDTKINGAETIIVPPFSKKCNLFKFDFLKQLSTHDYRTFVFLDADTLFVRHPPPLQELMRDAPVHAFFECDCTYPALRPTWWGCPLEEYVAMMRDCGVTTERVYNVNGGMFMVDRKAIATVCGLAEDFWKYALSRGYAFTEEPPLAYAVHMLCNDPEFHLLSRHFDVWASDWTAQFKEKLPIGEPWLFKDWMRGQEYTINPAIVHALKSKDLLVKNGIYSK